MFLPAAAGAGGSGRDHLEFRLSGPTPQDVIGEGAILVRARCLSEPCTVVAAAESKNPSLHTGMARAKVDAGHATTLSLPISRRQRGKLKAALEAGHHPSFTIEATAHDQAGSHVSVSMEVTAKKP